MSDTLQRLADRIDIQEALYRYARGIDRRNWDFLASAFHPGARIHQGDFRGSIEEMIENVKARHAAIEQSAHLMTNIQIEFDGSDGAVVETYYLAYLRNDGLPAIMRTALIGGCSPGGGEFGMRSLCGSFGRCHV